MRPDLALLFATASALCLSPAPRGEGDVPPTQLILEGDGIRQAVSVDEAFTLTIGGKEITLTLREMPTRRLDVGAFSFEYPAGMSFEYEQDSPTTTWTLSGNDVTILLFRLEESDGETARDTMADAFADLLDGLTQTGSPALSLAGTAVTGRRLAGEIVEGIPMQADFYALPSADDHAWVLEIQDSHDDPDTDSDEARDVRKRIASSFRKAE